LQNGVHHIVKRRYFPANQFKICIGEQQYLAVFYGIDIEFGRLAG
jgi:hypothetical protein